MKIKSKLLSQALQRAKQVSAGKLALPILKCARLESRGDVLEISVTNLDEWVIEREPCDGKLEPVCVNAANLSEWMSGAGDQTKMEVADSRLKIKSNSQSGEFGTINAKEFPELPIEKSAGVGVNCEDLSLGIKAVMFCALNHTGRPILHAVHAKGEAKRIFCEALDGANGAFYDTPAISTEFDVIIPLEFAPQLADSLSRDGSELHLGSNIIRVTHDIGEYFCKRMEGDFPNTESQRNGKDWKPSKPLGEISVKETCDALGLVCALADLNEVAAANLTFSKNGLVIKSSNYQKTIEGEFAGHEARVNADSLKKCLSGFSSEKVRLYASEMSATWIESGNLKVVSMNLRA